jgi:hypothetical protein
MLAPDANTGRILWQRFTMPDNPGQTDGYSGGAIWQPPAIDPTRGLMFIGTGNNYEIPESVKQCLQSQASFGQQSAGFSEADHFDSVMALHLHNGAVKWARRLQGEDVWTVACVQDPNPVSCPEPSSPDFDFSGSGPNLIGDIIGFGQKSGMYWAFHPENSDLIWSTMVGPGSTLGGIEWGSATDGQRIYAAVSNGDHKPSRSSAGVPRPAVRVGVGCEDRKDSLADGRSSRNHRPRSGERCQRYPIRALIFWQHACAGREQWQNSVDFRQRRIGNRRSVDREWSDLLGVRLQENQIGYTEQQSVRFHAGRRVSKY